VIRFVKNGLLFELIERKIGKNNWDTDQHSFDSFCKTPKNPRFSVFSSVKSAKLADRIEEIEREWFCKTLIINYFLLFRG
jgi:hypothetical protein